MRMKYPLHTEVLAALAISAVSLAFRYLLDPVLGALEPFAPGLVAVTLAAWFVGWRGAVLTALIVYFAAHYLFVEPRHAWSLTNIYDLSSFATNLTASFIVIWIAEQARGARDRAVAANESKDRFIAMVAHELRNPLATLKNALAGVRNAKATAAQREILLSMMERQTTQMTDILNDLLDVSRIVRGQITLFPCLLDLKECIEEAVAQARPTTEQKRQRILLEASDNLYTNADRTRIMQVLRNLIDNACKYSPQEACIKIELVSGDPIMVRISDDGPGVLSDLLPHLFELTRPTATRSSESGGLGLGLPVSKKLIELQGGRLEARNNAGGRGACFIVLLPAAGGLAPDSGKVSSSREKAAPR